jgi:hypothetical protein
MEVSRQLHAPAALPPGKEPLVPIRGLCGPQNWSGSGGDDKNSQPLPVLELPIIKPLSVQKGGGFCGFPQSPRRVSV